MQLVFDIRAFRADCVAGIGATLHELPRCCSRRAIGVGAALLKLVSSIYTLHDVQEVVGGFAHLTSGCISVFVTRLLFWHAVVSQIRRFVLRAADYEPSAALVDLMPRCWS